MLTDKFQLLSDPLRWEILKALRDHDEPLTPSVLAVVVGARPSVTSHHLVLLSKGDLVIRIPAGRNTLYTINPETFRGLQKELSSFTQTKDG